MSALIGLLAVIEGELMAGEVSRHLSDHIRDRLKRVELLEPCGIERDLRQSINDDQRSSDPGHVLSHAILSYVFGVVIVAGGVNLIAGLAR